MIEKTDSLVERLRKSAACLPLDAKRKPLKQNGIEGWYPYYAGFTEAFARGIMDALGQKDPLTVMDPWNGSGTTTRVAYENGHRSLGFDINPVATLVASAKVANPDDALHLSGISNRIARVTSKRPKAGDPLLLWIAPSTVGKYRAIESVILSELGTSGQGEVASYERGEIPPLASLMMLALLRTVREDAAIRTGSNPTWIRPDDAENRKVIRGLGKRWVDRLIIMANELSNRPQGKTGIAWRGTIGIADSKQLPVPTDDVDLIVTSPPYCTRIDYVVSASFELAALGFGPNGDVYKRLRISSMGTPLIRQKTIQEISSFWPIRIQKLLRSIRKHHSKDSESYYYKTYWQYFADAMASLQEMKRVLRPGGVAILVLQSSYYKEIYVDLPGLYIEMAKTLGFEGYFVGDEEIRQSLVRINSASTRHRTDSIYREAVIAMEKLA